MDRYFRNTLLVPWTRYELEELAVIVRIVDFHKILGVIFYVAYISVNALEIHLNRYAPFDVVEEVHVGVQLLPVFIHARIITRSAWESVFQTGYID
jgi:hypothetical protein